MIEINLLPGAARKTRRRGGGFDTSAAFAGIRERFSDLYLLWAIVGGVAGVTAVAGMYVHQGRQEAALAEREQAAVRDSVRFSAVLLARKHAETTRDSVYQQLAIIKSIDDSRYTWSHLLEEINRALPAYTWLTSVEQTSPVRTTAGGESDTSAAGKAKGDSAKKMGQEDQVVATRRKRLHADSLFQGNYSSTTFRIIGQTVDIQALTRFMKSLEASPFIKNVQLTRSDLVTATQPATTQPVTEFQLEAETEIPSPTVLYTVPLSVAVH